MVELDIKFKKCGTVLTVTLAPHVYDMWVKDKKTKRAINKLFTIQELEKEKDDE